MSNVTVFQTHNLAFFASDSAATITINGDRYRYSNSANKITQISPDTILCMAGDVNFSDAVKQTFLQLTADRSVEALQEIAKYYDKQFPDNDEQFHKSVLLGKIKNGRFVLYQLASEEDFKIVKREVGPGQSAFTSTGCRTEDVEDKMYELADNRNMTVDEVVDVFRQIYKHIACQEVGGYLTIYLLAFNQSSIIYQGAIEEPDEIKYYPRDYLKIHHICADKITGGTITAQISLTSPIINGGTITGSTIQTATGGNDRIVLSDSGLISYNDNNEKNGWTIDSGNASYLQVYFRDELRGTIQGGAGATLIIQPENNSTLCLGKDGATTYPKGNWDFSMIQSITGLHAQWG